MVKAIAGVLGGSSALLAEAAHSVAGTGNQGLLLISLRQSERPPDEAHPFGHGKERFFWVLLAAVFMFVAGRSSASSRASTGSFTAAARAVLSEDTAAIVGIAIAFVGGGLHQATGNARRTAARRL